MTNDLRDLSAVLREGLNLEISSPRYTEESEYTYPLKTEVWDNWLPFAYRAFRRIANETSVRSFASIGCGSGADAIGAMCAFLDVERIVVTDVDPRIIPLAQRNVEKYAQSRKVIALQGSLCHPLREAGITVDLMYENLPNLPVNGTRDLGSTYDSSIIPSGRKELADYLLSSHQALLRDAKDRLNPGGSIICSIGGRVPSSLLREMVQQEGYYFQELVCGFKVQTEPGEVLVGYAHAEKGAITFDFYDYEKAAARLMQSGFPFVYTFPKDVSAEELKEILCPYRISAQEALERYRANENIKVGHVVQMIRAKKMD